MKKTIVFLLILIGLFSEAQVLQLNNTYGWEFRRFYANTLLGLPKDTFLVPATLQDIPFIANKLGTLYTWNITTHVWNAVSAGGGASGIDDVLAIGQALSANRTIDLNGQNFRVEENGNKWLYLDVAGQESGIAGYNSTGLNITRLHFSSGEVEPYFVLSTSFNNEATEAYIQGISRVAGSVLGAWADEHEWYIGEDEYMVIKADSINIGLPGLDAITLTADSIQFTHNNLVTDTSSNYVQTIDKSTGTIGKAFWPSGGAADGNGIYSGSGTLPSAVAVDLNSNTLNFNQGANSFLQLDPTLNNEFVHLQSFNITGSGNSSKLQLSNTAIGSAFGLITQFDGGTKNVTIQGSAVSGQATTIDLTADTISFYGDVHIRPAFRLRLGSNTADIGTPANGDLFYNSTSNKFRAYENGAWVNMIQGITTLNTLTDASQTFATGTTGTDFNIASAAGVHTFHIPDAAAAARGFVNTGSQTFAGSKTFTGFTNLTGGHASSTVAGNSNLYVAGGSVGNRTTVAGFLPESAAGLGGKVFINGSTAYTITASDAFSTLAVASNNVTEAGSGTHPLISALVLRAPVVTNGAGATANMATFYIDAAPSGVTPTGATYAQWIKAGGLRLGGDIIVDKTITAAGTTGNQTINKLSGTVNIAAAGTTVTVTNSFVTASSIVYAVIRTNDSTAVLKNCVPGVGSFVINLTAAANAEISIGFLVIN